MTDRYSLNRRDKKLAGVCSTAGDIFNLDPTFIRLGFVAIAIFISWEFALVAYIAAGLYFHIQKNKAMRGTSVHDLRTKLDVNDRRMMAIDHHLSSQNDELAREIEALREVK